MLADAPPPTPVVLVVSETAGFHHDSIPAQQRFLRSLGGVRVRVLPRVRSLTAARLRAAGAVVFASTSGEPRLSATGRRALLAFVRGGGGFVGTHSAADTFARWPAFVRLLGGVRFTGHGPVERRRLLAVRDTVTRGLPRSFAHTDEYYRFSARPHARVLLTLDARGRPPLAWRRREGRGRVFYSALGHPIASWSDPAQQRLVSQGLSWVLKAQP